MRIAVTGASGFVGGAVCRALTGAGHEVVGFGRRPSPGPGHLGAARYRQWDLTGGPLADPPPVDAVVHCAGTVSDWGPRREFFAVNVGGTANALATWPGVRFVHVSTASVYDPRRPTVMAAEHLAPVGRYLNAYGESKAAAERVVSTADRPAIVLRPHAIYGPGDPTLLPRVLAAVRGRWLPAVGDGRQLISLTSVGNLAQACVLAACGPVERGVFNVTDAAPVPLDDSLRAILAARGITAHPVYLPLRAVWLPATVVEALYRLVRYPRPPRLTRYAISHLAVERTLDITAARDQLGYRPTPTSFAGAAHW
ncbi:NAD-dependent epimerase/dehydratase family protein [Catellatospora sp. KI3]|uniref:NAD-dependent epimerase/dehydratase family protein n=1 Tax=Catellatospora sp. KI3 TaxID=3041620 RepID=UPI0024831267|nr:NAD-dependent epimerase/dehydratase family protein [Catellatospora sp. KI3]MDI1463460.1 NAD-dependent epimerase/dehydratase family protein [Catellatospora sp. KI3]